MARATVKEELIPQPDKVTYVPQPPIRKKEITLILEEEEAQTLRDLLGRRFGSDSGLPSTTGIHNALHDAGIRMNNASREFAVIGRADGAWTTMIRLENK